MSKPSHLKKQNSNMTEREGEVACCHVPPTPKSIYGAPTIRGMSLNRRYIRIDISGGVFGVPPSRKLIILCHRNVVSRILGRQNCAHAANQRVNTQLLNRYIQRKKKLAHTPTGRGYARTPQHYPQTYPGLLNYFQVFQMYGRPIEKHGEQANTVLWRLGI